MVRACREKTANDVSKLSNGELDNELHRYVYSGDYADVVGVLYNYVIE